jgi:hypothetical protein
MSVTTLGTWLTVPVELRERDLEPVALLDDGLDLAGLDQREERIGAAAVVDRRRLGVGEEEHVQQRRRAHDEDERDDAVAQESAVQGESGLRIRTRRPAPVGEQV